MSCSNVVARIPQEILETEDEVDKEREHFWVDGLYSHPRYRVPPVPKSLAPFVSKKNKQEDLDTYF